MLDLRLQTDALALSFIFCLRSSVFFPKLQSLAVCVIYIKKKNKQALLNNIQDRMLIKGSRKEVFQPHLPVRLPCYDLTPVTGFTLGRSFR